MKAKRNNKARNKPLVVVKKADEKVTEVLATAIYTARETASYLRMKPQTLEVWRCLGRYPNLKATKVGGRIMYRGADILSFVESGR